jgi:hypothetical protein
MHSRDAGLRIAFPARIRGDGLDLDPGIVTGCPPARQVELAELRHIS